MFGCSVTCFFKASVCAIVLVISYSVAGELILIVFAGVVLVVVVIGIVMAVIWQRKIKRECQYHLSVCILFYAWTNITR